MRLGQLGVAGNEISELFFRFARLALLGQRHGQPVTRVHRTRPGLEEPAVERFGFIRPTGIVNPACGPKCLLKARIRIHGSGRCPKG